MLCWQNVRKCNRCLIDNSDTIYMNTNRYFSFSRLGLVMKRDLMENWKTNLYRFLGPYAAILIVMLMCYMNEMTNFDEFASIIAALFACILFLGGSYYASYIMETMNTQQQRISFLMLPATSLEKFVVRGFYVTIGFLVLLIVALLLAEATRYLFLPLFDVPDTFQQSTLSAVFAQLNFFADSSCLTLSNTWPEEQYYSVLLGQVCSLLYMAWMHSFYILGGCYWQKHPFWKTLGLMLVAHILVLAVLVNVLIRLMEDNWKEYHESLEYIFGGVTINQSLTFFSILFLLLIVLNWWLSYRCFTHSQVIKPKFGLL